MACLFRSLFNRLSGRMGRVIYYQVGIIFHAEAAQEGEIVVRNLVYCHREMMRRQRLFTVIRRTWLEFGRCWEWWASFEI